MLSFTIWTATSRPYCQTEVVLQLWVFSSFRCRDPWPMYRSPFTRRLMASSCPRFGTTIGVSACVAPQYQPLKTRASRRLFFLDKQIMKTPLHTKKVIKWQLINTNQVHSKPSLAPGLKPAAPWPFPLFTNGARDLRKLRRERDGADLEKDR